MQETNSYAHQ